MEAENTLSLHHIEAFSNANGPGLRSVVWLQGCTLACPGCFNPGSHPRTGGTLVSIRQLLDWILSNAHSIEGITVSGGEPLQQMPALAQFLDLLHAVTSLSVILFSGYRWEEINRMSSSSRILQHVDVLLAGRYMQEQRLASGLIGSANKTRHFISGRYTPADFQNLPEAEMIIQPDGSIHLSGIRPIQW